MIGELDSTQPESPLAINIKKWRERRGLSLSALARNAEISKSTVSELERGNGNPSLDTIWALARTLNIPLGFLFLDSQVVGEIEVRRLPDAPVVAHDEGKYITHLLSGWLGRGEAELTIITLAAEGRLVSKGNASGAVSRAVCVEGIVEVKIGDRLVLLTPADLLTFPSDQPHIYRAMNGAARLVLVQQYAPSI
jgi:transcriptional regulator with XRE-family HTH domain